MSGAIVIGAGLAGLTAAIRLAQGGRPVTLLSFGVGGLPLGQGTLDVLGYGADGHRVERPFDELAKYRPPAPGHPYAKLFADDVRAAVDWFAGLVPDVLRPGDGSNHLVPTALGAMRPTYLVPPSMVWPDVSSVAVVGPRQLKDFYPALVAANLETTAGVQATAHHIDLPARPGAECPPTVYASTLDDEQFAARFAELIRVEARDAGAVLVPAILNPAVHRKLVEALGRPVVEVILPPPSVPGLRLNQALTSLATSLGVRLIMGSKVTGFDADGPRLRSVTLRQAGRDQKYEADAFVYAPGGFESGALAVDSHGGIAETLFGLPLSGVGGQLIGANCWAKQRLFEVGVVVDAAMRPVGGRRAVFDNLHVAGGILGGAQRWVELSGDGIAVASAVRAADAITEAKHA